MSRPIVNNLRMLQKRHSRDMTQQVEKLRSRLLYQSKKRGILENDIIIGGFAEKNLGKMCAEELQQYDTIINGLHMEWDLYYYFIGTKEAPSDLKDCRVFQQICEHVNPRKSEK